MTRYDYCPWLFWREAPEEARREQIHFQNQWAEDGRFRCGERCYLSPMAGFVPERIILGDDCYIAAQAYVTDILTAGSHCTINPFAVVRGNVTLGEGVRVGAHANLLGFTHNHEATDRPIYQQGVSSQGIRVGDDVWIGTGAILLDGITIGSHSIIAAGAVVTKDIPEWSVAAGNPAKVIKDRRGYRIARTGNVSLGQTLREFGARAEAQWPDILKRCEVETGDLSSYRDRPDRPANSIRALADAIEIASGFGACPSIAPLADLIERLQSCQAPDSDMPTDPLAPPGQGYRPQDMNDGNSAYMILSIGYALECLGSRFARPLLAAQQIPIDRLRHLLSAQPWTTNAWGAGAWIDALGTALWMNRHHFGLEGPVAPLFDWLRANCNPATGLWGESRAEDGWLQPVNGFYRLTRGTYAQFDLRVPYPEAAMDTVLAHIKMNAGFVDRNVNACNLLDVVHPIWLLLQATDHRRNEALAFLEGQLPMMMERWRDAQGFGFSPRHLPGLQGTEMWLSIIKIAADALGVGDEFIFVPKGVHRLKAPKRHSPDLPQHCSQPPRYQAASLAMPTTLPKFRNMWV